MLHSIVVGIEIRRVRKKFEWLSMIIYSLAFYIDLFERS